MFISPTNFRGNILYDCDEFIVGFITNSIYDGVKTDSDFITAAKADKAHNFYNNTSMVPVYPRYIVLFKPKEDGSQVSIDALPNDELYNLRIKGYDRPALNTFLNLYERMNKQLKGDNNRFNFQVGNYNPHDGKIMFPWMDDIVYDLDFKIDGTSFTVTASGGSSRSIVMQSIAINNAFETITMPKKDVSEYSAMVMEYFRSHNSFKHELQTDYIVFPENQDVDDFTLVQSGIPHMTVDEMVSFFQLQRKSTSKADTMIQGFRNMNRNCKSAGNHDKYRGKKYVAFLTTSSGGSSFAKFMPTEWVLAQASQMKVLASSQNTKKQLTSMVVEIQDRPNDDFIANLYSLLDNQKRTVYIRMLPIETVTELASKKRSKV